MTGGVKDDSKQGADVLDFYGRISRETLDRDLVRKKEELASRGLFFHILKEIKRIAKKQPLETIVEVGSGSGVNLVLLKDLVGVPNLFAIDIVLPDASRAPTGVHFIQSDMLSVPPEMESIQADAVLMVEVIEHLWNPDASIRCVYRMLKPGGMLVLTTPNLSSIVSRLSLLIGLQPPASEVSSERVFGRPGDEVVGHIRLFTFRSMVEFLRYHGFIVVRAYSIPAKYTNDTRWSRMAWALDRIFVVLNRRYASRMVVVARKTATPH
jgi:SAM-dependent methyltransferase